MTYTAAQYKLTIFAKRSGSAENVPLRPADAPVSGSPFIVGTGMFPTQYSSSGAQYYTAPYMDMPRGSRGNFQLPDFKLQVGSYTARLFDKQLSSNIDRWVTQFIGNDSGSVALVGRKAYIEESTDNGQSWSPFFVGRISEFRMEDELTYSVTVRDTVDELKSEIFYQLPLVDYAVYQSVLPIGMKENLYGFTGSRFIPQVEGLTARFTGYPNTGSARFGLSRRSIDSKVNDASNLLAQRPVEGLVAGYINTSTVGGDTLQNLRCTVVGVGDYQVEQMIYIIKGENKRAAIVDFTVTEVPQDDAAYASTSSLMTNTDYEFFLYSSVPQEDKPVWLTRINPMDIVADVLDGKFSTPTPNGTRMTVAYDSASLASVKSTLGIDSVTLRIDEPIQAIEFIEDYICKPFQVGMAVEPTLSGSVPVGQIRFFSTKVPNFADVSGSQLIDDSHIVAGTRVSWEPGNILRRVEGKYYLESPQDIDEQIKRGVSATDVEVVKEFDYPVTLLDISDTEASAGTIKVDFNGLRAIATVNPAGTAAGVESVALETIVKDKTIQFLNEFYNRFSTGPIAISLTVVTAALSFTPKVGDFILLDATVLPNPITHQRSGQRLVQIIGLSKEGQYTRLTVLDSGGFDLYDSPIINSITSLGTSRAAVSVTTTEPVQVHIQTAIVTQGAAQPAAGDSIWTTKTLFNLNGTQTVTISDVPSGYTIYVRVRAENQSGEFSKLPSTWTYATAFNQPQISAPANLFVGNITRVSATAFWDNTATGSVELYLASPQSSNIGDFIQIADLPALSNRYPLRGLDLNTSPSHSLWVRYRADYGGYSQFASASFIASGSGSALPALDPLIVYVGA